MTAIRSLVAAILFLAPARAWAQAASTATVATATSTPVFTPQPPIETSTIVSDGADESRVYTSSISGIESIIVVGRRTGPPRITGSAHYLSIEQLERFEHDDIHRVLAPIPGVYVREEEGYGLRPNIGLRGASSDRSSKVTLMEDGVLLAPAPYSAPAAYYFPITTRMTGVEVFKGPASIRHGPNTIGGAINLLTRPIPDQAAGLDLGLGLDRFGKLHGHYGQRWENFGFVLEGVHLQSDGFKDLDGGGETGFDKNEFMLKAILETDVDAEIDHRLELKGAYSDETSNETYLGLTDADFEATPYRRYAASQRDRFDWMRTLAELRYSMAYERFELNAVFYRHDMWRDWTKLNRFRGGPSLDQLLAAPDAGQGAVYYAVLTGGEDTATDEEVLLVGTNARSFVSQGGAVFGRLSLDHGLVMQQIEIGARLHFDRIEREHTEDGFLMRSGTLVPEGTEADVLLENRGRALALALHLLDELSIGDLLLTPGLRFEHIRTSFIDRQSGRTSGAADNVIIPGIGAHYAITDWISVFAGVHRGFSPVSPGQAPEVEPETSINYEAGTRIEFDKTHFEAIGFFNDYSNLTGECTFSSGCPDDLLNAQFNGGDVFVYGLEASAGQGIDGPFKSKIRFDLAYTLTLSEFRSSFQSENPQFGRVEVGDELPYLPRHQASLLGELHIADFSLSAKLAYVGEMRNVAGQGETAAIDRIPQHLVLDAAASYVIGSSEIYLRGDNLTNTAYVA